MHSFSKMPLVQLYAYPDLDNKYPLLIAEKKSEFSLYL